MGGRDRSRRYDLAVLSLGSGPGLVVVHGSMQSAVSQLDLAVLLSAQHTVHLMERRGRGRSGPYPIGACTETEVGDVAAALAATGAHAAMGVSSGALLVGRVALSDPAPGECGVVRAAVDRRWVDPAGFHHPLRP